MGVWKDDTASTVAERIIRQSGAVFKNTTEQRAKIRELAPIVEREINGKVAQVEDVIKKHKLEMKKVEFQMAQLQREKKLERKTQALPLRQRPKEGYERPTNNW